MATNTNSRIWSVFTGTVHSAPSNYTAHGPSNRLIRANQQAESNVYSGLTDSYWINGINENRLGFTWHIAYLICDNQGFPQLSTTTGTQPTPPPDNADNPQLEENNEYIRFKAGSGDDAFIAAIQHIKDLNEAAGNILNNGAFPTKGDSVDVWKSWADSNLDYYTNFTAATTTTTQAPAGNYSWWNVTTCGGSEQFLMRAPQNAILVPDQGYDLSAVIIEDGAENVLGNHIVIYSEGAEGPNSFAIGSTPPQLECTA